MIEFKYPEEKTQFEQYLSENSIPETRLWFDGMRVVINDADSITAIPIIVSPRQIRQALNHFSLRSQVEQAVAMGDQDLKDWWEFATSFESNHPMVLAMASNINVSGEQLELLFTHAFSL